MVIHVVWLHIHKTYYSYFIHTAGIPPKYSEVTSIEVTSTYFTVSTSSIHRVSQATYSKSPSTRLNPIPTSNVVVINPEIKRWV